MKQFLFCLLLVLIAGLTEAFSLQEKTQEESLNALFAKAKTNHFNVKAMKQVFSAAQQKSEIAHAKKVEQVARVKGSLEHKRNDLFEQVAEKAAAKKNGKKTNAERFDPTKNGSPNNK